MAGAQHGGAEAFFSRLAIALERSGQVQTVAIRCNADRAATLQAASVTVTELPFGGWLDFTTRPGLKRLIRAFGPDCALTWMNRASAALPSGPFVRIARLGGYYDLKYYRRSDHLIGNTRDIVDYLIRQGWPAARAHYLPNFVDATVAAAMNRAQFDTPEEAPLVLALGRLHQVKGFDVLLHALARLPKAYLWLAGDGPERRRLEAQAQTLGIADRVRFLGWQANTAPLYGAADAVVCASRAEPLGNVVIEAWARHVPVIATLTPGPLSLIEDGKSGLLVPIEDADALASALGRVLSDAAFSESLCAAGWERYQAAFTESAVVRSYRDFFEQVLV